MHYCGTISAANSYYYHKGASMLTARLIRPPALLLACAIVLAACAGQNEAPPAAIQPSPAPSSAPTNSPPTVAPRPTALPAPTAPLAATASPVPSVPAPSPNPTADPATGAPALARGALTRRPIVVMIDNHPDAYPQTGLDRAAVVFEALAEFGVTRFMAVYAPGITPDAPQIGPIRSTRLYFVQWAMGFHPLYAHAGGSPQGLELVQNSDQLINLEALKEANVRYFARSSDRVAPHNLYTSSADLEQAAAALDGGAYDHPEVGFLFKPDAPVTQRPATQRLDYFFLYKEDDAGWKYDPQSNGYLRLRRGRPARDAATEKQLWTKNVVLIEVAEARIPGDAKGRIDQEVLGTGEARVFMDGVERAVKWRKPDAATPLRFYDASGDELRLNAGPVWIVALPSLENLTVE
jgi:Protein of unknown function (DUF3048) N-terminal domain/Protein of unknown function (DUF3048) C-terminal domain